MKTQTQEYGMEYASARATPELVGRSEILGLIGRAIEAKSSRTHVIYITGWGGMGKTRLLEEMVKRWGKQNKSKSKETEKILIVRHMLDLYHTHTHSEEGLIAEIVDALDLGQRFFKQYRKKRDELTHMKFERGETQPIQGLRGEMIEAFLRGLNELGKVYEKVILVFDTAEVLTYETDRVQEALGLADKPLGVARWLTQDLVNQTRNVVVLIAGRPETPQLSEELKKTRAKIIEYELSGFSEKETLEYFDVVAEAARRENPQSAKRIESIPKKTRQDLHYLTKGEPFQLALLIDYLAIAREIPSLERRDPDAFREELRDLIVEAIEECWRPLDQVVEALSLTPKGMGAESLAWILKRDQPEEEDVSNAEKSILSLREPEKRLSFVKIRSADDLVFLQDEMYALMERAHNAKTATSYRANKSTYVNDFYEWKLRQTRWKIKTMEQEFQLLGEITAERLAKPGKRSTVPEEEKIRKGRARLHSYQVEQVYYKLRSDPLVGFELYLQYAEEAFQGRDLEFFLLLRDELLLFVKMIQKNNLDLPQGLTLQDIEADMGTRWVQVSLADEKYDVAERQMAHFRETCPELLQPGSYADLNLKIWENWILAYTGKDHKRAWNLLDEILGKVGKLPSETSLDKWRVSFLKAYAISMQGYLYRTQGEFKKAVGKYLEAVPLWRELKLESEHSNTLNNLAWAEAEAGDFKVALDHCNDALQMRRQLGRRYLIGLSLNTLGLIETREGSPEKARFRCEQALRIFREIEDVSGIGLACLAYAEALRRTTNVGLLTHIQSIEYLDDARRYAEEAVEIFAGKKQPLRLVEAYIEVGCVYRELARHLPENASEHTEVAKRSLKAYDAAVAIADKWGYEYRAIDALVNKAWLYYYVGEHQTAEAFLKNVVKPRFEDEHLYTTKHGVDKSKPPTSWNWVQLGKANILLGMIHFDAYRQANRTNKVEAEKKLRQAAHDWTLSMAYNSLYGKDFRDFSKGREQAYDCLHELNIKEMKWVTKSMEQTHREYQIEETERSFQQFLQDRLGVVP